MHDITIPATAKPFPGFIPRVQCADKTTKKRQICPFVSVAKIANTRMNTT